MMEMCEFDCELKDESDKAYLVVIDDMELWVPKSLSQWNPKNNQVDGTIEIAQWWAEKENLA